MFSNWRGNLEPNARQEESFSVPKNLDPLQIQQQMMQHHPLTMGLGGSAEMLGEALEQLMMEQQKVNQYWMEIQAINQRQREHEIMKYQMDEQKKKMEQEMFAAIQRGKLLQMNYQQAHTLSIESMRQNMFLSMASNNSQQVNLDQGGFNEAKGQDIPQNSRPSTSEEELPGDMDNQNDIRKCLKRKDCTNEMRERNLDWRVTKLLGGISPAIFVEEEIPGCTLKSYLEQRSGSQTHVVHVMFENLILGEGRGETKEAASQEAAEKAIKTVYCNFFFKDIGERGSSSRRTYSSQAESPSSIFPWTEFAPLCLHILFTKWNEEGINLNFNGSKCLEKLDESPAESNRMNILPPNTNQINPDILISKEEQENFLSVNERVSEATIRMRNVGYGIDSFSAMPSGSNRVPAQEELARAVFRSYMD